MDPLRRNMRQGFAQLEIDNRERLKMSDNMITMLDNILTQNREITELLRSIDEKLTKLMVLAPVIEVLGPPPLPQQPQGTTAAKGPVDWGY